MINDHGRAAITFRDMTQPSVIRAGNRPYSKWFGTAFARLPIAAQLAPPLQRALAATRDAAREAALVEVYSVLARAHNASGLTAHVDTHTRRYHDRPFVVLGAGRFTDACRRSVTDGWLTKLALTGSVGQLADRTDLLASTDLPSRVRALCPRLTPGRDRHIHGEKNWWRRRSPTRTSLIGPARPTSVGPIRRVSPNALLAGAALRGFVAGATRAAVDWFINSLVHNS